MRKFLASIGALSAWMWWGAFPVEAAQPLKKVLISKIVDHPALNKTAEGIVKGLKEKGFEEGKNLEVRIESAQADGRLAQQIATKYIHQHPDVVVGIGTVAAQSFIKAAKQGKAKLVFSSVTDPLKAELVGQLDKGDPFVTGVSNYVDLQPQLDVFLKIQPGLKRLGFLYNSGEANSESLKEKLKELCPKFNITLVEQTVNKTADVMQNATKLAQNCDAIFVSNDSTVLSSLPAVVTVVRAAGIPLYVSDTDAVEVGAVAALGPNQTQIGIQTGYMIADILNGADIASKKIEFPAQTELVLNKQAAKQAGISFSPALLHSAALVIEETRS